MILRSKCYLRCLACSLRDIILDYSLFSKSPSTPWLCFDETWSWRLSLVVGLHSVLTPLLSIGHDSFVDLERRLSQLERYLSNARPGNLGCKERRGYGRGCGLSSNRQPVDSAESKASDQLATMKLPEPSPALLEAGISSFTCEELWTTSLRRTNLYGPIQSSMRKIRGVSFMPSVSPSCIPSRGFVASADQYLGLGSDICKQSPFKPSVHSRFMACSSWEISWLQGAHTLGMKHLGVIIQVSRSPFLHTVQGYVLAFADEYLSLRRHLCNKKPFNRSPVHADRFMAYSSWKILQIRGLNADCFVLYDSRDPIWTVTSSHLLLYCP